MLFIARTPPRTQAIKTNVLVENTLVNRAMFAF